MMEFKIKLDNMLKKLFFNEMILGKLKMMVFVYKGNFEWKWFEWDVKY